MNLTELKSAAKTSPGLSAGLHVQITERTDSTTDKGKPYIDVMLADASGAEKVRLWEDSSAFKTLTDFPQLSKGTAVELTAAWKVHSQWGLQAEAPRVRALNADEMNALFSGGAAFTAQNEADWNYIYGFFGQMAKADHPMLPLGLVCMKLLDWSQESFRRAAAAHGVHHARRGGLLAHTCSMLRVAVAICREKDDFYPEITPEILYAGILFHDIGKTLETDYQERGFALEPTLRGVLVGHIAMGFCLLVQLWKHVHGEKEELLRDHVAHVILAHHGRQEWGSPLEPATPEAVILHQIDMMDAGIEKMRNAYRAGEATCLGAVKAVYPNRGSLGLPYNTSADFARHQVSVALWFWAKSEQSCCVIEDYEVRFVEVLFAEGIVSERLSYRMLPRPVLDKAIEQWGMLRMHCNGLPALVQK